MFLWLRCERCGEAGDLISHTGVKIDQQTGVCEHCESHLKAAEHSWFEESRELSIETVMQGEAA